MGRKGLRQSEGRQRPGWRRGSGLVWASWRTMKTTMTMWCGLKNQKHVTFTVVCVPNEEQQLDLHTKSSLLRQIRQLGDSQSFWSRVRPQLPHRMVHPIMSARYQCVPPRGPLSRAFSRTTTRSLSSSSLRKSRARTSSWLSWVGCLGGQQ